VRSSTGDSRTGSGRLFLAAAARLLLVLGSPAASQAGIDLALPEGARKVRRQKEFLAKSCNGKCRLGIS